MLWKHQPRASVSKAFSSSPKRFCLYIYINRLKYGENVYISLRRHLQGKKKMKTSFEGSYVDFFL